MPRKPLVTDVDFNKNPAAYERLVSEQRRTHAGARTMFKVSVPPEGLGEYRITSILSGAIKYPTQIEYDYLMGVYSKLPTVERIKITSHKLSHLKAQIKEKKIRKADIAKALPKYLSFNVSILRNWLDKRATTADRHVFDAVMKFVEQYEPSEKVKITDTPTAPRLVSISPEFLDQLESEIKRTNFEPYVLIKRFQIRHINSGMILDWRAKRRRKARPENLALILDAYKSLPGAEKSLQI